MNVIITLIPEDIKYSLAKLLDRRKEPNWKTFVDKTPKSIYSFMKGEKEFLRLEILKKEGSPTLKLIENLGKKKVKVCQFIEILESLEKDENINKALDLFMGEPPSIVTEPPSEIKLNVGDDVTIRCEAVGKQPILHQWFKEGELLKARNTKELCLSKVTPVDEGMYICRVANVRGYQFSRWIRMVVEKAEAVVELQQPAKSTPHQDNDKVDEAKENERSITIQSDYGESRPCVTVHPQSVTVFHGSLLSLSCDCDCEINTSFQWLKDQEEIPGATNRDLVISPVSQDHEGTYTCRVFNNVATVSSRSANVRITKNRGVEQRIPRNIPEETQGVCDKVALLIGNKDYDHCNKLGKLYHPTNDVRDIAGILQSIGFKVISLVNLRLNEMQEALKLFAQLLNSGVYALFYFAGHGFEVDGTSYLMSTSADDKYSCSENLPANDVLRIMQEREAKLKVLLIDSCRTTPGSKGSHSFHDPIYSGGLNAVQENVVIAFGCCSQGRVFEHRQRRNGYFAMHLLEHLGDHEKNVEQVLLEVAKGVRKEQIYDSFTGQIQMVYRHSSLAENWSLSDRIVSNENDSPQALEWQRGHELPEGPVVVYEQDDVTLTLRFDAEFSNVMIIRALIETDDDDVILHPPQLHARERTDGVQIKEMDENDELYPEKYAEDEVIVKITNLQRLKGKLLVMFNVRYINSQDKLLSRTVAYEFKERPLYARLTN